MSKIEKALSIARKQGTAQSRPAARALSSGVEQPSGVPDTHPELPIEVSSRTEIALMREQQLLSPDERFRRKIIAREGPESPTLHVLREIRTRIAQGLPNQNSVILVTSIGSEGGATFVAVNLGAAFALDEARTSLLIDCNILSPHLDGLFAGSRVRGLTDYLVGIEPDMTKIIQPTGIERLRVIPVGTQSERGSEFFSMDRMKHFVRSVRDRYDDRQIVIDAPAIMGSADTQALLDLCDFVVLVARYGVDSASRLEEAVKLIDPEKILGVIINDEPNLPPVEWRSTVKSILKGLLKWRGRRDPDAYS